MKSPILILVVACMQLSVFAQKTKVKNDPNHDDRPIHFGFSLGLNAMDYRTFITSEAWNQQRYVGVRELSPGINIHAIANLRLAENFDIRALPGISFGERYLYFVDDSLHSILDNSTSYYKKESSFLEFPLLLKYKSKRLNNIRPYLIGGGNVRYDLAVKSAYSPKDQLIMTKPLDFYGELGFGSDFYLTYFKLGIELKYSFGLTNVFTVKDDIPDEVAIYSQYISKMFSHMFILSFHFE